MVHYSALNSAISNQIQSLRSISAFKWPFQAKWLAFSHQIGEEEGHEVATIPNCLSCSIALKGEGDQLAWAILKWKVEK